jgi:toxin ParE1/3/4
VPELVWTRQAVQDVEDIKLYIGRTSRHYAALVAERIVESAGRLREFPTSGRVVPEFSRDDVREIIWGNYRVVYRIRTSSVDVLTVYHGARLLKLELDK